MTRDCQTELNDTLPEQKPLLGSGITCEIRVPIGQMLSYSPTPSPVNVSYIK